MSNNIGRNDPCPCRSGLKFKKCCINDLTNIPQLLRPTRYHHWSQVEIREMPTELIIKRLEEFGIDFNRDVFLEEVKVHFRARDITKGWKERYLISAEGYDVDFIWMACEVLWEKLAPHKLSTEQLDDMMQDGYSHLEEREEALACELWLEVWEELKKRFTPEMKSVKDAEPIFNGYQCLFNWCQDLEQELGNAGVDDKRFHEHRIRYCREFCNLFPKTASEIIPHMKRAVAESLFLSGKRDEGEVEFQKLVDDYPDDPWGYIAWGDVYSGFRGGELNVIRAEELYRKALVIDPAEEDTVMRRIEELQE